MPFDVIHCNNPLCDNLNHHKFIDKFYADILSAILSASEICFKKSKCIRPHKSQIFVWNEDVKHLHDCARTAFQKWIADDRCIDSQNYSNMKEKRRIFKKALKECKKRNEQCKADYLVTALQNDRSKKQFWLKVKSVGKKKLLPTEIEGNFTPISITEMWISQYSQLLNSSPSQCHKTAVLDHLCDGAQYKNINKFTVA